MILAESPFFDVPLIAFLRNKITHQEFPKKHLPNKNRYFSRLSPNQSMHQTPEDQQKVILSDANVSKMSFLTIGIPQNKQK